VNFSVGRGTTILNWSPEPGCSISNSLLKLHQVVNPSSHSQILIKLFLICKFHKPGEYCQVLPFCVDHHCDLAICTQRGKYLHVELNCMATRGPTRPHHERNKSYYCINETGKKWSNTCSLRLRRSSGNNRDHVRVSGSFCDPCSIQGLEGRWCWRLAGISSGWWGSRPKYLTGGNEFIKMLIIRGLHSRVKIMKDVGAFTMIKKTNEDPKECCIIKASVCWTPLLHGRDSESSLR